VIHEEAVSWPTQDPAEQEVLQREVVSFITEPKKAFNGHDSPQRVFPFGDFLLLVFYQIFW
jgi:hypothetical protein